MRRPDFTRRVAVTGLGIISPVGQDITTAWDNLVEGHIGPASASPAGTRRPTRPGRRRGQRLRPQRLDGLQGRPPHRQQRRLRRRRRQAGAGRLRASRSPTRTATTSASSSAPAAAARAAHGRTMRDLGDQAARARSARSSSPTCCPTRRPARSPSRPASAGPNMCIVTACSTGTHNIGEAAEGIRRGDFIAAITGSTETPLLRGRLHRLLATCAAWARPARASRIETVSRPFDQTRNGFVLGEGAGALMLEDLELRQGARRAGLRRGRGLRLGGRRLGPHPADREGRRHAARHGDGARAPRRAGRRGRPHQPARHVDAAGRPARGAGASGPSSATTRRRSPSAATKSMTGHLMGAAGAIEGVFTVLSVHHQVRAGDAQLPRRRSRRSTSTSSTARRARWRSATRCPTTSASAATTARSSSSATTATDSDDR